MSGLGFEGGVSRLTRLGQSQTPIVILCAKIDPRHCHRRLCADCLQQRGVDVIHITNTGEVRKHFRGIEPGLIEPGLITLKSLPHVSKFTNTNIIKLAYADFEEEVRAFRWIWSD